MKVSYMAFKGNTNKKKEFSSLAAARKFAGKNGRVQKIKVYASWK